MGKRPEMQEVPRGGPSARAKSEIVTSLTEGNRAMRVAYDAEYSQRLHLVRENESMERESLAVEVEIKGLSDQQEDLSETVGRLTERHDGLESVVGDLNKERDTLSQQNREFADLQKGLDEEVSRLRKLQTDYMSAVGKFREARRKITGD